MDDNTFKKRYRVSACTEAPFKNLIPFEDREATLLKIKQESLDLYGEDLSGECVKRLVCVGKTCLGRPLPVGSPTATPYLEQLKETHKIVNNELFINNCGECPIAKSCKTTCKQVDDFLNRDKIIEPIINYVKAVTENIIAEGSEENNVLNVNNSDIPWDCLPIKWKEIVDLYQFQGKDYNHIAKILGIRSEDKVKYKFYLAMNKLSKFAIVRKFLLTNPKLTKKQQFVVNNYFIENKNITSISQELNITPQACRQSLKSFYKKHNLKWKKFVFKKNKEVIYNVPQVLK